MTSLHSTIDRLQTLSDILVALLLMPLMDVAADSYTYSPIITMPPATTIPPIAVVENKDGGRTSYADNSHNFESGSFDEDNEEGGSSDYDYLFNEGAIGLAFLLFILCTCLLYFKLCHNKSMNSAATVLPVLHNEEEEAVESTQVNDEENPKDVTEKTIDEVIHEEEEINNTR